MPRQSNRYALDVTVELYVSHRWHRLTLQDLSKTGMFIAMPNPLPIGTPVVVALAFEGERVTSPACVTHRIDTAEAHALSRTPGIGVLFREPHELEFKGAVETLLRRARTKHLDDTHIVVADSEPRLLERMSTALGDAGFSVATASSACELFGAALRRTPDVVLVDRDTPIVDGMQLLERFACDDTLASVPVIMMTREPGDIAPAFARGAADVVLKPFTMVEIIARARRVAQQPRRAERTSLAGSLADVEVAAVLMLLEQQRKSGRLVISNGHVAWIDIVDGRVVDAGWSIDKSDPRVVVMAVLAWAHGTFRLTAAPRSARDSELALPITHLLLEQARLADEGRRLPS